MLCVSADRVPAKVVIRPRKQGSASHWPGPTIKWRGVLLVSPPVVIVLYLASAPPFSPVKLSFVVDGASLGVLGAGTNTVLSIMITYKVEGLSRPHIRHHSLLDLGTLWHFQDLQPLKILVSIPAPYLYHQSTLSP